MYHQHQRPRKGFNDVLDLVKSEFEQVSHESQVNKMQRDEMEHKLEAQLNELQALQQSLFDIERTHTKLKQQYEEEVLRLRRLIDNQESGRSSPSRSFAPAPKRTKTEEGFGGSFNLFGNSKARQGSELSLPNPASSSGEPEAVTSTALVAATTTTSTTTPSATTTTTTSNGNTNTAKNGLPVSATLLDAVSSSQKCLHPDTSINVDLQHALDHQSVVCCVRYSSHGNYLATGCNRAAIVYHVETGDKLSAFPNEVSSSSSQQDSYVRSVCFSPDSQYLAAGAEDKKIKVWDLVNKTAHHTLEGHELDIYALDFSHSGRHIVSGSGDRTAKLWDMASGKCQLTFGDEKTGPTDGITTVAISPDGTRIASGSLDRAVYVWNAASGQLMEKLEGHSDSVYSVTFSPDGKYLASGSLDKSIRLWDLRNYRSVTHFTGHTDFVLSVTFSRNGQWLLSGSKDRTVKFWDPRFSSTHLMLQGHKNSVISVAHSPIANCFATGSGDCKARQWTYDVVTPS